MLKHSVKKKSRLVKKGKTERRGKENQRLRFISNGFNQVQSNSNVFTANIGKKFKHELGNCLKQFEK